MRIGLVLLVTLFFTPFASLTAQTNVPTTANGGAITIFGLQLGERIGIPECPKRRIGKTMLYEYTVERVCFQRSVPEAAEMGPVKDGMIDIKFPLFEGPAIAKGGLVMGIVFEEALEGITFNTNGVRDADAVLTELKEKFGEPESLVRRIVRNTFGATFDAFDAVWLTPEAFRVIFNSVDSTLGSGTVRIQTAKAAARFDQPAYDPRPL